MKPLRKGIHLPELKDRTLLTPQIHLPEPARFITLLLNQHAGPSIKPCVEKGDSVFVGTKIAEGADWNSVPLHSSTSGHVSEVTPNSIVIESDERDSLDPSIHIRSEIPTDPDQLVQMIREAGLVDLGGSASATHVRLAEARSKGIHTLILNGCESEPFLTCDHMLMLNHAVEILKGAELLRVASGASRAVIAVERNKLEAIEILNSKNYNLKIQTVETATLPVRYPQGMERCLVETFSGRRLEPEESSLAAGVLVENVATAFAAYEAVSLRKPLYERVITIDGPCVVEPKNLWARIGTRPIDLLRSCKGLMREPERIIFGGPMMGETIEHLETPITKKVQGILALPAELTYGGIEEACIRCGRCVEVCPESLIPETLVRAVRKDDLALAAEYNLHACTECGSCAYICPSRIPLVTVIRKGKNVLLKEDPQSKPAYAFSSQG